MSMLNYLGALPGPGKTMPGGMPGSGAPEDPMAPPAPPMGGPPMGGPPMGGPPMGGPPMGGPAGPPMGMPGFGGVGMVDPAGRQYEAVTQEDGTVLLHVKNPDGSRGPAVKIIAVKQPKQGGGSAGA